MPGLSLLEALKHHLATGETPESIRETQGGSHVHVPLAESPVSSDSGFSSPPVRSGRAYAPGAGRTTTSKARFSIEELEQGAGNAGQIEAFRPRVTSAGEVEPPLPWTAADHSRVNAEAAAAQLLPPPLSHAQQKRYWAEEHAPADSRDRAPVARKPAPPTRLTTDQTLAEDLAESLALTGEVAGHALETDVPRALEEAAELYADDPGAEATLGVQSAQPPPSPCELPTHLAELPQFAYVCGPAGVGKTYWAKELARNAGEACVLAATTGIASVNLGEGTTINSLLKYFDTASLREAYTAGYLEAILKKHRGLGLERILLDEVSMMAGEQLTIITRAMDNVNQDRPEGVPEMGLILLGDFAQLAPIGERDPKDPKGFRKLPAAFAFESAEWDRYGANTLKLTKIRRQADREFVEALQAVRRGAAGAALEYFRGRMVTTTDMQFPGPTIVAKNEAVGKYNQLRLDAVQGAKVEFASQRWGKVRPEWGAKPKPEGEWGVPEVLRLKEGCRVMILANKNIGLKDEPPRWAYTNGDLGTFLAAEGTGPDYLGARVKLDRTGTEVVVGYLNRFNEIPLEPGRRKALKAEGHPERVSDDGKKEYVGGITYVPLRLAYATTVHKCVSAGTRVNTASALVPISALSIGSVLRTGGPVQALAATTRQAYQIVTQRGYTITASAEHRWETKHGWVATHDLCAKRASIALDVGTCKPYAEDNYAWWLGAMVGNGTYNDRREGQLHFSTTHQRLGARWRQLTLELGAQTVSWRKDDRGLHTTSRALRNRVLADGLDYVTCRGKRIPSVVWVSGPGAWRSFVRGLFDCDGSVSRSGVVWTTASEGLGVEVHELLLALGVVSDRRRYPGKVDPYWQVRISADSLDAFRQIGFWHPEKEKALDRLHPNRVIKRFDGYDAVLDVRDLDALVPMVDIEVGAPHVIGTGAFRSHNSQGLSLDQVQINIRDPFFAQPGMLYVALSRARTVEGLRLVGTPEGFRARCTVNPKLKGYL